MYNKLALDLIEIFNHQGYLSIILDQSLKLIDEKDHKLYTKILYGVVEKRDLIDYYLAPLIKGIRVKSYIKNILRIGAYSITYLSLADHYIVNELVENVKKNDFRSSKFVNAVLRNYQRNPLPKLDNLNEIDKISIMLSLDKEITKLLYHQYGTKLLDFYLDKEPFNTYRINNLKINNDKMYQKLDELNIDYEKINNGFITKANLINSSFFIDGLIIMQDYASMQVVDNLDIKKNDLILDACSAPGGKSLYLASKYHDELNITACDIYEKKLKKIKDNMDKLGIHNVNVFLADATSYSYPILYDVIICDAPCSGLGTINHKVDLKYHINLKDINEIKELQKKILNHLKQYVKQGGILQYSTCTINQEENEEQIKAFLLENQDYKMINEIKLYPSNNSDGFYICKLQRK